MDVRTEVRAEVWLPFARQLISQRHQLLTQRLNRLLPRRDLLRCLAALAKQHFPRVRRLLRLAAPMLHLTPRRVERIS